MGNKELKLNMPEILLHNYKPRKHQHHRFNKQHSIWWINQREITYNNVKSHKKYLKLRKCKSRKWSD